MNRLDRLTLRATRLRVALQVLALPLFAIGCDSCDSKPPLSLKITSPAMGATITSADDADPATPGVQFNVVVEVGGLAEGEVVSVFPHAGVLDTDPYVISPYQAVVGAASTVSVPVTFSDGPSELVACARTACSVKSEIVTISVAAMPNAPSVTVTAPVDGLAITQANKATYDCAPGTPTLDLLVTATTNASDGSAATITIGTLAPVATTVSAGTFSNCVPAEQFGSVPVVVQVTDTVGSDGPVGTGTGTVTYTYAPPPGSPITPLTTVYADHASRRAGKAGVRFAAVTDTSGATLASYELRCSFGPIVTAADWTAATVVPNTVTPVATGSQTIPVQFAPGLYRHCLVRGTATGGALTPLPMADASVVVNPGFEVREVSSPSGLGLGYGDAAPVGDVNGDSYPDFVQPGFGSAALYLGSATLSATTPSVLFTSDDPYGYFGTFATGIGDFNGDSRPDFAISNPYYNDGGDAYGDGIVYVFYGRAAGTAWPATIALNVGASCAADLCFATPAGSAAGLGSGVLGFSSFDKDAGSLGDLAMGAPGLNQALVVLGSSSFPASGTTIVLGGASPEPNGFRIQGTPSVPGGYDFAYDLVPLGDLDSDGYQDLGIYRPGLDTSLVQSPTRRSEIFRVEGRAHTGSGMTTLSSAADIQTALSDATWNNGRCLFDVYGEIAVDDFDTDGILDIACMSSSGSLNFATVVYGQSNGTFNPAVATQIQASVDPANDAYNLFGAISVSPVFGNLGDVDNDGKQDLLLGNFQAGPYTNLLGANVVYARTGRPASIDPLTDAAFGLTVPSNTPPPTSYFEGRRVAYVGDLNKDGWMDVVVGDPGDQFSMRAPGRFFILY